MQPDFAPTDLRRFEKRVYSQNGEDGILQEIFRRIGVRHPFFVEFGVEAGIECNCARLALEDGWRGLFLEAADHYFYALSERYRSHAGVRCLHTPVTSHNIETLLSANDVPVDFDLLSIDIDGNDYWVWNAITRWQPRVVVIEYNASHPPPKKWVMKENLDYRWNGTTYFGASLASLAALGSKKGYALVATDTRGVNAFFVRRSLIDEQFLDPALYYYYAPPHYGPSGAGHPRGEGPHVEI